MRLIIVSLLLSSCASEKVMENNYRTCMKVFEYMETKYGEKYNDFSKDLRCRWFGREYRD